MQRFYPQLFVFLWSTGFIGAISLLNLRPPTTALVAHFIFGENLTLTVAFGMAVAVRGVYLVARTK